MTRTGDFRRQAVVLPSFLYSNVLLRCQTNSIGSIRVDIPPAYESVLFLVQRPDPLEAFDDLFGQFHYVPADVPGQLGGIPVLPRCLGQKPVFRLVVDRC